MLTIKPRVSRKLQELVLMTALVAQMSLEEKLNITQQSISNAPVGAVERLGYPGLFYADGSEGVRGAPFASSMPQALTGGCSPRCALILSCRQLGPRSLV